MSSSCSIDGVVEMMLDATQGFSKALGKERLCDWHASLFLTGHSGLHRITVGDWRRVDSDPMQIVSGPLGREKIHFEAPSAEKLDAEMAVFSHGLRVKAILIQCSEPLLLIFGL